MSKITLVLVAVVITIEVAGLVVIWGTVSSYKSTLKEPAIPDNAIPELKIMSLAKLDCSLMV